MVFEPLLASVFAVPLVVFLPLFILFFGIGVESKIAFGAAYAFFPIALNTIGGISQVDPRFVTVARSMGASERQLFRRVLLPAALPVIATGLRIGCTIGFLSILGSEMIAGLRGLGSRIVTLAEGMNTGRDVRLHRIRDLHGDDPQHHTQPDATPVWRKPETRVSEAAVTSSARGAAAAESATWTVPAAQSDGCETGRRDSGVCPLGARRSHHP